MADEKQSGTEESIQAITDQKEAFIAKVRESRQYLRKGVNVLPTSDPQNPAPNPFVQGQTPKGPGKNQQPVVEKQPAMPAMEVKKD